MFKAISVMHCDCLLMLYFNQPDDCLLHSSGFYKLDSPFSWKKIHPGIQIDFIFLLVLSLSGVLNLFTLY